jgi:hypothetical protein
MNSSRWFGSLSSRQQREKFDINSGHYNIRASFTQWLKYARLFCPCQKILTPVRFTWLDILTMAFLGVVALSVNKAGPAPNRSFPVSFQDGEIVYPQFAYPIRNEIIPLG